MLILSLIYLLLSNAVNSLSRASIFYSRVTIFTLIYCMWSIYNESYFLFLTTGIGLFNGLFYINSYSTIFCFFLFLLCLFILHLTSFQHINVNTKQMTKIFSELTDKHKSEFITFYKNKLRSIYATNTDAKLAKLTSVSDNDLPVLRDRMRQLPKTDPRRGNNLVFTSSTKENIPSKKDLETTANDNEMYNITEYPLIILFVVAGSVFLMSSADLVSVFLSIELQSYGLYLLSSSFRNSETATGGGLTYFLLGGLSSTFILLAASFIYANSGNTLLENVYIISDLSQQNLLKDNASLALQLHSSDHSFGPHCLWYNSYYLHLSLVMAGVGFLFKVSAAPFHFWSPDVYDAIPTVVTTFVAIIAKISIFIFLLELVYYTGKTLENINFNWTVILLVSSFLSLIIGSVLGLTQHRIKRLYAYSTISHVGFILLALSICSVESIQSYLFYIMQYSLSNLNAFFLLLAIGFSLRSSATSENPELQDKENSPIQLISQLKGYCSTNPMLALSLIITLFSFIGVPPLIGFFAKQMVLSAALDKGYIFIALVAILTSVISAVYYLAVVKNIFFDKADEPDLNYVITNLSFVIPAKYEHVYFGDFLPFEVNSSIRSAYTRKESNNELAEKYKFSTHGFQNKNQVVGPLNIIISMLSMLILLFMFTPVEWLNLSSILSLSLFYY